MLHGTFHTQSTYRFIMRAESRLRESFRSCVCQSPILPSYLFCHFFLPSLLYCFLLYQPTSFFFFLFPFFPSLASSFPIHISSSLIPPVLMQYLVFPFSHPISSLTLFFSLKKKYIKTIYLTLFFPSLKISSVLTTL